MKFLCMEVRVCLFIYANRAEIKNLIAGKKKIQNNDARILNFLYVCSFSGQGSQLAKHELILKSCVYD